MDFSLKTPDDISIELSKKIKQLRLIKKWKRTTLADRSGVTESSLRRFEQTGKVSLDNFLKLIHALGRLNETESWLKEPVAQSLKDLQSKENKISKRGIL